MPRTSPRKFWNEVTVAVFLVAMLSFAVLAFYYFTGRESSSLDVVTRDFSTWIGDTSTQVLSDNSAAKSSPVLS